MPHRPTMLASVPKRTGDRRSEAPTARRRSRSLVCAFALLVALPTVAGRAQPGGVAELVPVGPSYLQAQATPRPGIRSGTYEVVTDRNEVVALIELRNDGGPATVPVGIFLPTAGSGPRAFRSRGAIPTGGGRFWFPTDGDGDPGFGLVGGRIDGDWFADRTGARGSLRLRPTPEQIGRTLLDRVFLAGGIYPLETSADSSGQFAYRFRDFEMDLLISDEGSELEVRAGSTANCPPTTAFAQLCEDAARDGSVIVLLPPAARYPAHVTPDWSSHTTAAETLGFTLDPRPAEVAVTVERRDRRATYRLTMVRVPFGATE